MSLAKKIISLVSPHVFEDIDKIDPDKEGLLDYCPQCNETLPDRKVKTLKIHQRERHPRTDKEIMRQVIRNASPVIGAFMVMFVLITTLILYDVVFEPYFDEMDGHTLTDECSKQLAELHVRLYETSEFRQDNLETLQFMAEECNLVMRVYPVNPDEWQPFGERESLFENKEFYENRIEWLEEKGYR